ncbi:MAG: Uma2 family endonuclease [Candidatus Magnetoovum sp. WYHC-5]|nr:Uma2 family endonuclease [Candidatus Magnetoovum sp. WYHC-5]
METATLTERDFDLIEIINGEEVMSPSPYRKHQRVSMRIIRKVILHLEKDNNIGELYYAPLDVIFKEGEQRLQPDLLFIKKENMAIAQDWIRGVPDMVCEIVSIGSIKKDTITKKEIYEQYRVPEYWIVIPELQTIGIFTIEADKYQVFSWAEGEGIVSSKIIKGLQINIKDIFEEY